MFEDPSAADVFAVARRERQKRLAAEAAARAELETQLAAEAAERAKRELPDKLKSAIGSHARNVIVTDRKVEVELFLESLWSDASVFSFVRLDINRLGQTAHKMGFEWRPRRIYLSVSTKAIDAYGNPKEAVAYRVEWAGADWDRVNWPNAYGSVVMNLANKVHVRPVARKGLNETCKDDEWERFCRNAGVF